MNQSQDAHHRATHKDGESLKVIEQRDALNLADLFKLLHTSERGLTSEDAALRLLEHGPNALPEVAPESSVMIFIRQFQSPLIYMLFGASAIVFVLGDVADAMIILAVLLFNSAVGAFQEGKAQHTLAALKHFVSTEATVLRDEQEVVVPDSEVVPGDVIVLREGEKVSADARMIVSESLTLDEAAMTGESIPVHKVNDAREAHDVARRSIWKGTYVVLGSGRAVVTETGRFTKIGKIAGAIAGADTEIPLKKNIRLLSRLIMGAVALLSIVLFFIGIAVGESALVMFTTVVTLAVSIIPEGLPIVMTLVLAAGVGRMSKQHALVKKLQAVEALGQAKVIAVDKTGTITKNEMVVQQVFVGDTLFDIEGVGYEPKGAVMLEGATTDAANHPELLLLGKLSALSARAHLTYSNEETRWRVSGDPTEAAIIVLAQKLGFHKEDLLHESPHLADMPFDYHVRYRASMNHVDEKNLIAVLGAPEVVLEKSTHVMQDTKALAMGKADREAIEKRMHMMSRIGLRVIAVAMREKTGDALSSADIDKLTFVGLIGMKDALRPEVASAMERAHGAGIRVVMITGDHRETAAAIAKEAGIYKEGDAVFTGAEIDLLTDVELSGKLHNVTVFARVTPEHKLRIVQAYKERGEIIAMTGDGVNDAPSLVAADLGVAMGKIGTEVAKEAADIVLLDDNFGSIVVAVEEGRGIYNTIRKVVLYLLSTGVGEALVIVLAILTGLPLPLLPAQIIWLNFVTDGFLDLALAMEPKEKGLLLGAFRRPSRYIVDKHMAVRMMVMAIPMALGSLYVFTRYYEADIAKALTMTLTTLAVFQWWNAWNCRSDKSSMFAQNPFTNRYLVAATVLVAGLQILAVYHPFLQRVLHTVPLSLNEWGIAIAVSASIMVAEEARKAYSRWGSQMQ